MATLSGTYLDLITDGLPSPVSRSDVVVAVRSIMLSAHRAGVTYDEVYTLLTDTSSRRLAKQIATGRGGRQIGLSQRRRFIRDLWDQTATLAAERPAWSREDALAAIEFVRENWRTTDELPDRHRAVLNVVLDLATEYGTTRPAVPSRIVSERTGIPLATANRILRRLAKDGRWLRLVMQGNRHTKRASLYMLAPELLQEFTENIWGASPPMYHPPPTSHPPTSHSGTEVQMSITVAANSPDALRAAIQVLLSADPEAVRLAATSEDLPRLRLVTSEI